MQLLDQKRTHPPLDDQVRDLRDFVEMSGIAMIVISQIDRRFETTGKALPDLGDLRLPNPVDLNAFSKACFLNEGRLDVRSLF